MFFFGSIASRFLVTFLLTNHFFEPSRCTSLGTSFPFVSLVYIFSEKKFLFFFKKNFLLLRLCFSLFPKKKVCSFLFSRISFKFFSLLALVSEFNCFDRSRCSMEMWCPDDTGRDCWDWVGPLAWERACFNSPEWGGGSSPV